MAKRKSFLLRVEPKLWEEIERWAADDLRSANAQVEFLLRQAVNQRRKPLDAQAVPSEESGESASQETPEG